MREFGCFFEKKYFKNKLGFPSSYLMLFQNSRLPRQVKIKYGDKIQKDFDLSRLSDVEESDDRNEALAILNQASRLISTKYQQHEQVKDANIAYGFARNVSGGLFLSIPASIVGIIMGVVLKNNAFIFWSSIATFIYLTLALFHKNWIISNAEKYAEKLFSVFLADKQS